MSLPHSESWLDPASRAQLDRDLSDLPELVDQLEANYGALLARGGRNPDDPWITYPASLKVIELADKRTKGAPIADAADQSEIDRLAGSRRLGVLPSLEMWVRMVEADMLDLDIEHRPPRLDDTGTVTTAAGWIAAHLDWIAGRQEVQELAAEVRGMVIDLERVVGAAYAAPDPTTVGTVGQLAAWTGVSPATLHRWAGSGWLEEVGRDERGKRLYLRRDVEATRRRTRGSVA